MYGQEIRWNIPGRQRKILAFSDLHFCKKVAKRRIGVILTTLKRVCQEEKIDYIFFLGDLLNSLEVLNDALLRTQLKMFLTELAELAPVIIVTGNHDLSYYSAGANRGMMCPWQWYRWVQTLVRNKRIHVLDAALGPDAEIFDDGVVRILGMSLPEVCYPTTVAEGEDSVKAFRGYAHEVLPKLTSVKDREYYLLLHSPSFLPKIELDSQIAVLAGHMHNGLVPPILDEIVRPSDRGLVGPGYYDRNGRKKSYVPFAHGARYRPTEQRPWLTLNSCVHLPPESWLWGLDGVFPAVSYAVITGEGPDMSVSGRYFWC